MSAQPEVWRVNTVEGIFETDLETLKQWIVEGCVLPTDKVCKGNLSWIDAGRVPKLKDAFSGETNTAPKQNVSFENFVESNPAYGSSPNYSTPSNVEPERVSAPHETTTCHNHPDAAPEYLCRMCGAAFCKQCMKFAGGKVPMCPLCGDLCHEYRKVVERTARAALQSSGFGIEDFVRAVRYPLQHKSALLSGAVIYALLMFAGFRGSIVAWVILFGCISHVISQVAWGRLNRSFMPDFSSFSLWDDLIVPAFLGVGIMIVTWGPLMVLVFALIFGAIKSGGVEHAALGQGEQASESLNHDDLDALTDPNADPQKLVEANQKLQETRPGAQIAREAEQSKAEAIDPAGPMRYLLPYLGAGIVFVLLFLLLIAWGVFYYPMALTVAGYTQSFGSVLNPLVGLDTIRRMGTTYFKAFGMVILVQLVAFVVGVIIAVVTSPFALPFMGNLVGNFINATFTFYFYLVIACILGLSLFKSADRLGIAVD
jgi:Na+-dependent transporters of the SNF family